jgi:hypothetical protein
MLVDSGQEEEIVLQNPVRIIGYLAFSVSCALLPRYS